MREPLRNVLTCLACLIFSGHLATDTVNAQPAALGAAEVTTQLKAAYLYRFGSYVEWPARAFEEPHHPFMIGVFGGQGMADVLEQVVTDRTINGREVKVVRIRSQDLIPDVNILFISAGSEDRVSDILIAVRERPILTVTESERAFSMGSMINFVVVGDKVRFDIAPGAAVPADLGLSARLMLAARKVASN